LIENLKLLFVLFDFSFLHDVIGHFFYELEGVVGQPSMLCRDVLKEIDQSETRLLKVLVEINPVSLILFHETLFKELLLHFIHFGAHFIEYGLVL
jgi:hypothetical protein